MIYNEDCNDTLLRMSDNSVQCIITSPPYFNLRDYECDGQIGIEDSVYDYIANLVNVFENARHKLKKDGLVFVNLGDTYKNKSLLCIPDRFKIAMVEKEWYCRNDVIWHKPNAMPSSVKDRFVVDYERVLMFSKNKKYKFNTQYEERRSKPTSKKKTTIDLGKYKSIEQESSVRQGMNKSRGTKLIEKRNNLPSQKFFVDFLRQRTNAKQIADNSNLSKSKVDHWFRYDEGGFSYPSVEDWNNVKWIIDDWSEEFKEVNQKLNDVVYEYDDINKNAHKGRIKRSVWSINTKPSKVKHFAPYPKELIEPMILSATDEGDLVYDPFIGSGTTAIVCQSLNRNWIGSELNKEYADMVKNRIKTKEK